MVRARLSVHLVRRAQGAVGLRDRGRDQVPMTYLLDW